MSPVSLLPMSSVHTITMTKCIFILGLVVGIAFQPLHAQPPESADSELQGSATGEIRQQEVPTLQQYDGEIRKWLENAPNDQTGKQSSIYPKLQAWSDSLHQLASSHKQTDAFKMIPLMADILNADKSNGDAEELKEVRGRLNDSGFPLIMAAGAYVQQQNGQVDPAILAELVKLFSVRGFDMEPDWENDTMPIDAAGLMIINPVAVVNLLKSEPWQRAEEFIGGRTAANFFERYQPNGDGLAVLKSKYAAQQPLINAKFKELLGKTRGQEN